MEEKTQNLQVKKRSNHLLMWWPVYAVLIFVLIELGSLVYMFFHEEDFKGVKPPEPPNMYSSSKYVIGTGNKLGTYFPAGQILANYFTSQQENSKGGFVAEQTNGSMDNIYLMQTKRIHFGMSESRIAKEAYLNYKDIRIVWPLWVDVVQILQPPEDVAPNYVFPGSGTAFLGQKYSSTARTSREILQSLGLSLNIEANIPNESVIDSLSEGKLGFAMIQAGIPNRTVANSLVFYRCQLVSFSQEQLELIKKNVATSVNFTIPAGYYDDSQPKISTIALPNVLFATKDTPNELVEYVVENLISGCEKLKGRFKTFETIPTEKETILKIIEKTGVPLHDGAKIWLEKELNNSENGGN